MIPSHTRYILWDWNGTLLDDALITYQAMIEVFKAFRIPFISFEDYRVKFRIPVANFYRDIGIDLSALPMDKLAAGFHHHYESRSEEFRLHTGVEEILMRITATGRPQSIFSAHPQKQIESAVNRLGIRHHFDHILGATRSDGSSKIEHGKSWFQSSGLQPHEVTLIGDTNHDADVAMALGFNCILVATGHQSREVLDQQKVPVVENLQSLLKYL